MGDETEYLLIASETSDPYATVLINPKTGVSVWSYKGNELQGAVTGCVETLDQNCFIVVTKDKPLLHLLSADNSRRLHVKSVLPKPVRHLIVTHDGSILFAAINNQIYIWIVATGELIAVIDAHYRSISSLVINFDSSLLVSGAEDGTVCVFVVAELLSTNSTLNHISPFREWRPHSLAVSNIAVTRQSNARILSCSRDHTAALHSLTANMCLLKISCDVALLCCTMDPAECRIFLGTAKGSIAQLDLYTLDRTELSVVIEARDTGNLPLFDRHSAELTRLDVNHDGTLLASGDVLGAYMIWDISSRQCLKASSLKGPICKLKFITQWKVVQEGKKKKQAVPISSLKRQKGRKSPGLVPLQDEMSDNKDEFYVATDLERVISDYVNKEVQLNTSIGDDWRRECVYEKGVKSIEREESSGLEIIETLKAKIATLEKANQQIYDFAASVIIDRS